MAALAGAGAWATVATATEERLASLPPVVGTAEVFALDDLSGTALSGFDPVSYFLGEGPKPGLSDYQTIWGGAAWWFSSAANRDAFLQDPEVYAPRLGGYDATAVAGGLIVAGNPRLSVLRENRLYLFRTDHARARFAADERLAEKAEERWLDLRRDLVQP